MILLVRRKTLEKLDKRVFKKDKEELREYLQFQRRGSVVRSKKGKGSFSRKAKHKGNHLKDV